MKAWLRRHNPALLHRAWRARRWIRALQRWLAWPREMPPPPRFIRMATLRRLEPISRDSGLDRGTPVDRHYIEDFLSRHAGRAGYALGDVGGNVLEIGEDRYSRRFGRWGQDDSVIAHLDVLQADDLTVPETLPSARYDCVICTQTLQTIYDVRAAIAGLHEVLKPGGVLLATMSGISTSQPDIDLSGDYWRFTTRLARQLFEEVFPPAGLRVEAYGNVLTATAFLYGLAAEELRPSDLAVHDRQYQLVVTVRAVKDSRADL